VASKIIDDMNWRYATKKFDPKKEITKKDLDELLETLRLSPSSYGLQPWKFLVITDEKLRKDLRDNATRGQAQITDASHMIALCVRTDIDEHVSKYIKSIMKTRGVSRDSLRDYENRMTESLGKNPPEKKEEWASRQIYIALGFLLFACAAKHIDACPMEGFDAKKFDEILGLKKKNLKSVVLCTIGYRGDDGFAKRKKVRFEKKDVFEFL